MKAAVCRVHGAPLEIEELELASPQGAEVKVKVAACSICHSDITYADGGWGEVAPVVLGHEVAGVITETGPQARRFRVGERVIVTLIRSCGGCHFCSLGEQVLCETRFPLDEASPLCDATGAPVAQGLRVGGFAEFVTVEESQLARVPEGMSLDCASLLACGVITGAGAAMNTARVRPGANVVVIGAGGVGLNTVQGAAICGAKRIIAVDLSDKKLAAAREFGATDGVLASERDLPNAIRDRTEGRGADYVFVTVGAKMAFDQSYDLLAPSGEAVLVGMATDGVMSSFDPGEFANAGKVVRGSKMGSAKLAADIPYLSDLYRQKRLKLDELISGRYPLEQINDAIAAVKAGDARRNVVVLDETLIQG